MESAIFKAALGTRQNLRDHYDGAQSANPDFDYHLYIALEFSTMIGLSGLERTGPLMAIDLMRGILDRSSLFCVYHTPTLPFFLSFFHSFFLSFS